MEQASFWDVAIYSDQEKELPRGELLYPLSLVHSSLNAVRNPLPSMENEQLTRDSVRAAPSAAHQRTFFLTSITTTRQCSVTGGVASSPRDLGHTTYDTQGNVRQIRDAANNVTYLEMWDNFSNKPSGTGETHGMVQRIIRPAKVLNVATTVQDGAKFDWYTGNPVESYHIQGTTWNGAHQNVVTYTYDGADRRIGEYRPDGGWTTFNYWENWRAFATYTLLETGKQRYNFNSFDGAGRTIWQGGDHPNGTASWYTGQQIGYDSAGRQIKTTNPTAMNGSFAAIDDDATLGFQWTNFTLDALDRPTLVTRPDNDTMSYSYNGCGCAGSSTVEVTDERGKKRKTINDHLGRLKEAYNLTPAGATVSRAVYAYTPLDQLTTIAHYDSGTVKHQDRTFAYDGYGRLTSQTTPEAGTTSYTFTARDEVLTATNANSRTATFTYEGRGLVTDIDYNGTDTQDVHYEYNEYGSRTLMQEKNPSSGTVESSTSYSYNAYEQLQSETRQLKGLSGTYPIGYQYNLAGLVKTMTYTVNSWSKNVNYDYTYAAALKSVGTNIRAGYGSGDNTNVMSGLTYRGFGAVKLANYGNGRQMTANYDAKRLQMTYMSVHSASNVNDKIVSLDYNFYNGGANNGRLQKITDYLDGAYTTTYAYDDLNRLASATATAFTRSYTYDAWANLTNVTASGAGETGSYSLSYATNASGAPLNNRINNQYQYYDNAGNMTVDVSGHVYAYDAVNRIRNVTNNKFMEYDGDGRRVLLDESAIGNIKIWYLWSSVLGQVVSEMGSSGLVYRAYIYSPSGQRLAQQGYDGQFQWIHTNHLGNGYKMTDSAGAVVFREEYDPHGQTVLRIAPSGPWYLSRKFTGYERDYGTNTDYANARQYHHNNGRFMRNYSRG
jgi:YD repeat-containing protein